MLSFGAFVRRYPVPKSFERLPQLQTGNNIEAGSTLWKSVKQGKLHAVSLAQFFQTDPITARRYLLKDIGAAVQKSEPLARQASFLSWFSQDLCAPVAGLVESFHEASATLYLREPSREQIFCSPMSGIYEDCGEYISLTATGLTVQGAYGEGEECFGEFQWFETINGNTPQGARPLIVGMHMPFRQHMLDKLSGVRAIITAGCSLSDIVLLRARGITVVVTEGVLMSGIDDFVMSKALKNHLDLCCGFEVSLFPETRVYAGAVRPVLCCSHIQESLFHTDPLLYRCIRAPYLGVYGILGEHNEKTAILFTEDGRELTTKMQNLAPVFA